MSFRGGNRAHKLSEIKAAGGQLKTPAGTPGQGLRDRLASKAELCAHFSYLRSQASKCEWLGMKINLELKGGNGYFILGGFAGCPSTGIARRAAKGTGLTAAGHVGQQQPPPLSQF